MRTIVQALRHAARVAAAIAACTILTSAVHAQTSVPTQHYDNTRSGAYTTETQLTPANVNVNTFGKLFSVTLDASVNGQVLYVPFVTVSGVVHNVIYAYTSENGSNNSPSSVYAFDADNGTQLWRHQLTPGGEFMTCCPVIDTSTNTIYIVTKDNTGTGNTNLRALDITTGNEKTGSPIVIAASVPGTGDGSSGGVLAFNTADENSRPGLLLLNGNVYFSTSNTDDVFPWHGWLLGYHYDGTQFTQTGVFCSTPNGGGGGIWMGGSGIASDASGNIYVATGNGTFDANTSGGDYAMCYVKLSTPSLSVLDWYSPHDEASQSNTDLDLGGGGVAGIPGTSLMFGGISKFGSIFLINTANMGHFNATTDTALQRIDNLAPKNAFTSPVVWNDGTDSYIYIWPVGADLMQFQYDPTVGLLNPAAIYKQVTGNTNGGGMVVSSNGTSNAIVWAVGQDKVVRAFSATDVSQPELWDSSLNSTRDGIPSVVHLSFPMVANGKLYVPYVDGISVYGLLGSIPPVPAGLTASPGNAQVALSWTASTSATSYNVYRGTTAGGEGATPIASGLTSTAYTDTGVTNGSTYYYKVSAVNAYGISAMSTEASATPVASTTFPPIQIDCGSPTAVSPFVADVDFSAGNEFSSTAAITTTGVTNAAPAAVYQTVRWNSSFTYTIPGLTAGQPYTVRLHFCELTWTAAGQRKFDVAINGVSVLSAFDVFATAGGKDKALVEQLTSTANASGQIVIAFTQGGADNPEIAGIEILPPTTVTPPPAPTNLIVAGGNGQNLLQWSASAGATSYNVYRGTSSGGEGATPIATGITSTNYTDSGLSCGTTYYYKVSAVNSGGTSPLSNEANFAPTVPTVPTGLTATGGNAQVSLAWTSTAGVSSYNVYRGTVSGGEGTTPIASVIGTGYTDTGLANGTTYYYKVAAVNCVGTSGGSTEVSATPESTTVPAAPTGLTAVAGNAQNALSWTASSGATSYNVYRGTASGSESSTAIASGISGITYIDSAVSNDTSYWYYVKAVDSAGTSTASNEAAGTPSSTSLPDLIVTGISWTPNPLTAAGNQVVFTAVIKNIGTGPTPSGTIVGVQFAVDGNESVITWNDKDTTSLVAGGTVTLTATGGTNSINYWPATAGSHTVQAWVNDVDRFNESNLNNNKLTASFSVP